MELPDSIKEITVESTVADPFNYNQPLVKFNANNVTEVIRHNLPVSDFTSFDEGRAFYKKDVSSDSVIISNLLALYSESLATAISTSNNIQDELKPALQKAVQENIKGIQNNINSIGVVLEAVNKQKNILDVKRISCILLGYATDIIRRIYNS
jgi:hypothetical protein